MSGHRYLCCLASLFAAMVALAAPSSASLKMEPTSDWVWPLNPRPTVVSVFDPPAQPWLAGHRGVDLLGSPGQLVSAIGPGEVTFASSLAGRGVVVVSHGALRSTYEPVTAGVEVGEPVRAGDPLGSLQAPRSHCAPSVCLHLGLRRGADYLDPLSLLGPLAVHLKPIGGTTASTAMGLSPGLHPSGNGLDGGDPDSSSAGHSGKGPLASEQAPASERSESFNSTTETPLSGQVVAGGGLATLAFAAAAVGLRRRQARG